MTKIFENLFDLVKTVVAVLLAVFLLRAFVFQPFVVEGASMEPNFQDGEYLVVERISYSLSDPRRGDVVVFRFPANPSLNYIKRIVGLPGETIDVKNGTVMVDGKRLNEPYILPGSTFVAGFEQEEWKLKTREYFVLGDNRSHSSDSREWGVVPRVNIIGRAFFVVYPLPDFGLVKKFSFVVP
jgi:signal peptidase I